MRKLMMLPLALLFLMAAAGPPYSDYRLPDGENIRPSIQLCVSQVDHKTLIECVPGGGGSGTLGINTAGTASVVLKTTGGVLLNAYATSSTAIYLMAFNATTVPANGSTTFGTASGNLQDCAGPSTSPTLSFLSPESFSVGMVLVASSTACGTLTTTTTAFIHGNYQ